MLADLLAKLATAGGPVGITLVLVYLYVKGLSEQVREVESKRVADAQAMVQKLLDLNDKWNEAVNSQVEVQEASKQLLGDLRQLILDQQRSIRR